MLSGLVPGGGALAVKVRRLLKHVGIKPARTSKDPRKDHAGVLAELRNVVGHGQRVDATTVEPWAAEYLADEHLDVTVRDLVRDVIERLALSGGCGPGVGPSPAPASG